MFPVFVIFLLVFVYESEAMIHQKAALTPRLPHHSRIGRPLPRRLTPKASNIDWLDPKQSYIPSIYSSAPVFSQWGYLGIDQFLTTGYMYTLPLSKESIIRQVRTRHQTWKPLHPISRRHIPSIQIQTDPNLILRIQRDIKRSMLCVTVITWYGWT